MAYLNPSAWLQQQKQRQDVVPQQQAPSLGSAPSAQVAPAQSGAAAPTPPQAQTTSFPNISAYMNANKDQGQALAQQVGSKVGGDLQAAQQEEQQYGSDWTKQNQDAQNAWQAQNDQGYATWQAQQAAAKQSAIDQAKQQAQNQYGGSIVGPGAVKYAANSANRNFNPAPYVPIARPDPTPFTPDLTQANAASDELGMLNTPSGGAQLLTQMNAPANGTVYTPGMASFDAALAAPGLTSQYGALQGQYGNILGALAAPTQPAAPAVPDWQPPAPPTPENPDDTKRKKGGYIP